MRVARSGPTRLTEGKDGGPDRDRTVDLLIAIQVDWGSASSNAFIKPFLTSRGEPDDRRHVVHSVASAWGRPFPRNQFDSKDLATRVQSRECSCDHGGASRIPDQRQSRRLAPKEMSAGRGSLRRRPVIQRLAVVRGVQ